MIMKFTFHTPQSNNDRLLIKSWWTKPHVMEFWDNSPEMWQNVENYFQGSKDLFDYWLGYLNGTPFALIMASEIDKNIPTTDLYYPHLDPKGLTMSLDFMIGEEAYLGKGFAPLTLKAFAQFLYEQGVTNLLIDPEIKNHRAVNAYQKAGFEIITTFTRKKSYFTGMEHYMMQLKLA